MYDCTNLFVLNFSEALEQNNSSLLEQTIVNDPKPSTKELTRVLERAILFKSDAYVQCIETLIKYGANVDGCDGRGTPYLVSSVEGGCEQVVRALVSTGCDINRTKQDGCTALHKIVATGQIDLFKLLLNNDCHIDTEDNLGRTPLLLACSLNYTEMAVDLLALCHKEGDSSNICNRMDNSGTYPLYYAISHNNLQLVQQLISQGADINIAHNTGVTPLMAAAYYGFLNCLDILCKEHCFLDTVNSGGETALLIAAKHRHFPCFRYLKEAGANLKVVDKSGNSPLLYMSAYPDIMTDLLNAGISPNLEGEEGDTAVTVAVETGHVISLMILLQHGADPDPHFSKVTSKPKPLQSALWKGDLVTVRLLFTACVEMGYDMTWLEEFLASLQSGNQGLENGNEAVSWVIKEIGQVENEFPKLLTLCRWNIREVLGDVQLSYCIDKLPLPKVLKDFLMFKELRSLF